MIDAHKSLSEKFLKKGFWLYLLSFIIAPIAYIIKILISNDLSVSDVGILYWIISIITLLSAFSDFWIRESLSYFIPQFEEEKRNDRIKWLLVFWFCIQLLTWGLIFMLLFFWADFISENYFKSPSATPILKVFAFFFLWINVFQLISNFFMAVQNTFLQKGVELLRVSFVMLWVLFIYFWDFWNLLNYSYAWIFGLYIGIIIAGIIFYIQYYKKYLKWSEITIEKPLLKEIFIYASLTFFSTQSFMILSQIDMQMVLVMLWATDAWYYTNYLSLVSIPNIILWPIFLLFYPVIWQLHAKKEHSKIKNIKRVFQKNFLVITLYFSVLFFILAIPLATILFWQKFELSWVIMQFSILFIIWNFLLRLNQIILAATWKVKERLYIILTSIAINFILNFILIIYMGVYGAALATWISWVIIWIITELILKEYYCKFNYLYIAKNLWILAILWFILHNYVLWIFTSMSRGYALLLFVLVSAIYFSIFLLSNITELKNTLKIIKRVKK